MALALNIALLRDVATKSHGLKRPGGRMSVTRPVSPLSDDSMSAFDLLEYRQLPWSPPADGLLISAIFVNRS